MSTIQHLVTLRKEDHCVGEFSLDTRLSSRSVWVSVRPCHKWSKRVGQELEEMGER